MAKEEKNTEKTKGENSQNTEMTEAQKQEGFTLIANAALGNSSTLQQAEIFLKERYDFRRNIITEKTEWSPKGENNYLAMTDRDYNSLYRKLQKDGCKIGIANIRGLLNSDFVDTFNPFKKYFDSLPAWDGKTDYILELAKTVKTTDDEFWFECFKRWIVALVGCATVDSITNHTVIVFAGKQGLGKTTWHLNLVPDQLKDYRYSGVIKPSNKDSIIHLTECILINLDELESLNRSELGDVKEMITKSAIRVRRPYGYTNEKYVRRASFVGSVNKSQFLTDATGSRRFLCFEVKEINYKTVINLDGVYAQAMHLLKTGFKYWFDDEEIALITTNNEKYQVVTVEEELLLNHFEPTGEKEVGTAYTTTEIAQILTSSAKIGLSNAFVINLGKALARCKFKRVKLNGVYKYVVKKITA